MPDNPFAFPPYLAYCPCHTGGAAEGPLLADYREHSTDMTVHFDLELVPGKMPACLGAPGGLHGKFKLASKISTGE